MNVTQHRLSLFIIYFFHYSFFAVIYYPESSEMLLQNISIHQFIWKTQCCSESLRNYTFVWYSSCKRYIVLYHTFEAIWEKFLQNFSFPIIAQIFRSKYLVIQSTPFFFSQKYNISLQIHHLSSNLYAILSEAFIICLIIIKTIMIITGRSIINVQYKIKIFYQYFPLLMIFACV